MFSRPCQALQLRVKVPSRVRAVAKPLPVEPAEVPGWTFLTNHGHVLVCIGQEPDVRIAEIARRVGIGERAVHAIVSDLVQAGFVKRHKEGRRNVYEIQLDRPLRHPVESSHRISELLGPLTRAPRSRG
jgi:DNA-binding transcriptional ArsR family regulator